MDRTIHRTCAACGTEWDTPEEFAPVNLPPEHDGEVQRGLDGLVMGPLSLIPAVTAGERKLNRSQAVKRAELRAQVLEHGRCPSCGVSVYDTTPPRPDQV
jgi:hypothetical protein